MRHHTFFEDARLALAEALANLAGRVWVSVLLAAVACAAGSGVVALSLDETSAIASHQQNLIARGAYVFQVYKEGREPFSGGLCESMNGVDGVVTAGGEVSSRPVSVIQDQYTTYWVDSVTPGFARAIWPDLSLHADTTVIAGSELAQRLGLVSGSVVATSSGITKLTTLMNVSAVGQASTRNERFDHRFVVLVPAREDVTSCQIEARPGADAAVGLVIESNFPQAAGYTSLPLFIPEESGRSPQQELDQRLTRWAPLVGAAVAVLALLMHWLARASEFALYRFLGFPRWFLVLLLSAETGILLIVPVSVGAAAVVFVMTPKGIGLDALVLDVMRLLASVSLAVPVGFLLVALREPALVLKDST